jgi:hypothetical protein
MLVSIIHTVERTIATRVGIITFLVP